MPYSCTTKTQIQAPSSQMTQWLGKPECQRVGQGDSEGDIVVQQGRLINH